MMSYLLCMNHSSERSLLLRMTISSSSRLFTLHLNHKVRLLLSQLSKLPFKRSSTASYQLEKRSANHLVLISLTKRRSSRLVQNRAISNHLATIIRAALPADWRVLSTMQNDKTRKGSMKFRTQLCQKMIQSKKIKIIGLKIEKMN